MAERYEYWHTVGFEETNVVGNVYFAHYAKWQGIVRERFLYEHAPQVIDDIKNGLKLFTVKLDCQFSAEVTAFDRLVIRMSLKRMMQTQVVMGFDYVQIKDDGEELPIATGSQHIAFMRGEGAAVEPAEVPEQLKKALSNYTEMGL